MKNKFLLTLLFMVALGYASMAQSISIGPRIGATFAKISLSEEEDGLSNDDIESNPGIQFGAVANFRINDMFSIQPELLYVQKGFKIGEDDMYVKGRSEYFEVPVLAKVSLGTARFHGFVTGGPTIGYWAGGEHIMKIGDSEARESYEFEDSDNRLEVGASFGIGAAYRMDQGELNLDVRYSLGFTSLYETENGEATTKNRMLGVSLAYLFNL